MARTFTFLTAKPYCECVFSELQNHTLKDTQPLVVTQIDCLLNDGVQKEENVSLINDGVKNVNIQRINNYSNNRKSFSQFRSDNSKRPYTGKYRPTQRIKKCTICKAGQEANKYPYIDPVKKNNFTKIYQVEYEQDSEYENDKFIHENASPVTPVTDNCNHAIPSLSKVQVCQSPTLELYYKSKQLKDTLDTVATASLITESMCRYAGILILPAIEAWVLILVLKTFVEKQARN